MIRFNQDRTCMAVTRGNRDDAKTVDANLSSMSVIYHCNPFDISWKSDEPAALIEQLFSTSLVAIVPLEDHNQVRIINTKKNKTICELPFAESVNDVRMNRKRLVILLQTTLQIYDVSSIKLLKKIKTTGKICDLSVGDESILVYQREATAAEGRNESYNEAGDVIAYDTINLTPISLIRCHLAAVTNLAMNSNGNILATSSSKGTLIRIFDTRSGIRLCEFRRGSLPTIITSLALDLDCLNVACVSLTGSVHIFQLPESVTELSSISSSVSQLLPSASISDKLPLSGNILTDLPQTEPITDAESDELHRLLSNVSQSSFTNKLWNSSKQYISLPKSATPTLKQPHTIIRLPYNGKLCEISFGVNVLWVATPTCLYEYTFFPTGTRKPIFQASHQFSTL